MAFLQLFLMLVMGVVMVHFLYILVPYAGSNVTDFGVDKPQKVDDTETKNHNANTANGRASKNIVVYHLGGGSFDVSILRIHGDRFEVKAMSSSGDAHLGGVDFNRKLMNHLIKKSYFPNVGNDVKTMEECERIKKALTTIGDAEELPLTREMYEKLVKISIKRTMGLVEEALENSGLKKVEIDDVVVVGGSSRIPLVQESLKKMFDGKQLYKGINSDEDVAFGAAVLGGVLSEEGGYETKDLRLLDVASFTLGVRAAELSAPMIPRNTIIPTHKHWIFYAIENSISIPVYECKQIGMKDCRELARLRLSGTAPSFRVPESRINVTFEVDANGILHVGATKCKEPGFDLEADESRHVVEVEETITIVRMGMGIEALDLVLCPSFTDRPVLHFLHKRVISYKAMQAATKILKRAVVQVLYDKLVFDFQHSP
ncbi:hypothetical protein FF1_044149 [Malus domestica]